MKQTEQSVTNGASKAGVYKAKQVFLFLVFAFCQSK